MTQSMSSSMKNLVEAAETTSVCSTMSALSTSTSNTLLPISKESRSASICTSQFEGRRQDQEANTPNTSNTPDTQTYIVEATHSQSKEKHNFAHKMMNIFSKDKTKETEKSHKSPTKTLGCIPKRPEVDEWGIPKYVPRDDSIVVSGHPYFDSLYAANDTRTPAFSVNRLGAPNDSTLMCGCENTECPFCNLVLSIQNNKESGVDLQ